MNWKLPNIAFEGRCKKIEEMCTYMYSNAGTNWFKLDRSWFCIVSAYAVFYLYQKSKEKILSICASKIMKVDIQQLKLPLYFLKCCTCACFIYDFFVHVYLKDKLAHLLQYPFNFQTVIWFTKDHSAS